MKKFSFVIHNENGLDARLAGRLIKETIACQGEVRIQAGEKTGSGKMIFNVHVFFLLCVFLNDAAFCIRFCNRR
jgi:phosphotransferase system HPr-like phosphotransfer protein